ncbi:MAG: hypothetical protein AUK16_00195 [Parcubacteria group bacterium CG2_30_44_11]|nr:MAG: hypothetical protein AUK16_00195 [Parcubacteria group bacterium CG2_30_44_11]
MSQRAIVISIVIFGLIVAGMFTFAYLKKQEMKETVVPTTPVPTEEVAYASVTRIDAKHFFIDGVHTLVGEIPMPTPCDLLESSARVAESFPEQIMINFSVINNADFCAQVVTAQRFKVSATASPEATFSAQFMGRPVELNLIPAGAGETPDAFELFIKG